MKILVIQLARFGDILQSWPALRALRRTHPGSEIHVLGRERFMAAFAGHEAIDRRWTLDTKEILAPLASSKPELDLSLAKIDDLVTHLREASFDKIINLSFSPVSSYLTEMISGLTTEVVGYSRHRDGYLSIPDDASAFFFAQVGPHRANRVHLTDLFAHIAGIELQPSDWDGPASMHELAPSFVFNPGAIVVHIGASQTHKTLGWMKWAQIVKGLTQSKICDVVLIGAESEREIAEKIIAACPDFEPISFVGQTRFEDLFGILRRAQLMVGGDSGPVHVASLTDTPVFNISFPKVSFWETGPRAAHSRVICIDDEAALPSDVCVSDVLSLWGEIQASRQGLPDAESRALIPAYVVRDRRRGYELGAASSEEDFSCHRLDFQWQLIRAIYMGECFPEAREAIFVEGVRRLVEVNEVALEQIRTLTRALNRGETNSSCSLLLDRVDEIIDQIARMVPDLGPLVRWFQTERLRVGPASMKEILAITESLHLRFNEVLALYHVEVLETEAAAPI